MQKLLLLFFFIPLMVSAQEYTEVVEVPNKTSIQLYNSAIEWIAETFKSANQVIQLADSTNGKIIAKGFQQVNCPSIYTDIPVPQYFTLNISFKDNKFKYQIYSTEIKTQGNETFTYEMLKIMCTPEGLLDYYETKAIKRWMYSKARFEDNLEYNKGFVVNLETKLQELANSLKTKLLKPDDSNDW